MTKMDLKFVSQNSLSFFITSGVLIIFHLGAAIFQIPSSQYEETYLIAVLTILSIGFVICGLYGHIKSQKEAFYGHLVYFAVYVLLLYSIAIYCFGYYKGNSFCQNNSLKKCQQFRYAVISLVLMFFSILQCIASAIIILNKEITPIQNAVSVTTISSNRRSAAYDNPVAVIDHHQY